MENKYHISSFVDALRIYSKAFHGFKSSSDSPDLISFLRKNIISEAIKTAIMAIREGEHFFIENVENLFDQAGSLKEMVKEEVIFNCGLCTLSFVPYTSPKVKNRREAYTLIVRCLPDNFMTFSVWCTEDLKFWYPLPYTVLPVRSVESTDHDFYSYWAQYYYSKRKEFMCIIPQEKKKFSKEDIDFFKSSYIYPSFQLFLAFLKSQEKLVTKNKVVSIYGLLVDEEGDTIKTDYINYTHFSGVKE